MIFPRRTDTFPCYGTAEGQLCRPGLHRSPYLFRNRWRRRSSRVPSLSEAAEAWMDRNLKQLRLRSQRRRSDRQRMRAADAHRRTVCTRPQAECTARWHWLLHKRISRFPADRLPSAIRTKHFDVRRDSLNTGLISRVHSGCSEVFNLAMHQQPQGPATIRVAEIELKTVQLSEALERRHLEVA